MNHFFRYAAAAAALVIIVLAIVIAPTNAWDAANVVSLFLFALSAALPLAVPKLLTGHGRSETGSLATIGLSGLILAIYFILAAGTFGLAMAGIERTSVWVATIVSSGWLIIASLVSRGAVHHLDQTFPNNQTNSTTRSAIITELAIVRSSAPAQFLGELDRLTDKLQYGANDIAEISSTDNASIMAAIKTGLRDSLHNADPHSFDQISKDLEEKIAAREIRLKAALSKV